MANTEPNNPLSAKLEIRTTEKSKKTWRDFAKQAGYNNRNFSDWVRRILSGEELHPAFEEVKQQRKR